MTDLDPANDLYWVPIVEVSFLPCLEGKVAVGHEDSVCLAEGRTAQKAIEYLRKCAGHADNWKTLSADKKEKITPFFIRQGEPVRVLECKLRHEARDGWLVCGEVQEDGINGYYGGCVLEKCYMPEGIDCPYKSREAEIIPRLRHI